MNNPIVKILRFLIFFPICFIAMAIINWGLGHLLILFLGLSKFGLFVVVVFLGGTIWGLFKLIASLLIMLASFISPLKWLSIVTISILSLLNGGQLVFFLWTLQINYSGWDIFLAIIGTTLVIELTFALIHGSIVASEKFY
jgi:hypothetical protein